VKKMILIFTLASVCSYAPIGSMQTKNIVQKEKTDKTVGCFCKTLGTSALAFGLNTLGLSYLAFSSIPSTFSPPVEYSGAVGMTILGVGCSVVSAVSILSGIGCCISGCKCAKKYSKKGSQLKIRKYLPKKIITKSKKNS